MRRHNLENKAKSEKNSAAPPAGRGQKISRLPDSNESIGRRARAAEIGSESSALPTLEENGQDQDDAVQYE